MIAVLIFIVASLGLSPACLAIESFSMGCEPMDGQFYGVDKVGFYCMVADRTHFNYKYSLIDLGHCIGNNNGGLVGHDEGAYQTSCSDCTLVSVSDRDKRTCYLKCQCYNMAGSKVETKVDLNNVLKNENGRLLCFGHRGTRDNAPPECHQNRACSTGEPRLTPRPTDPIVVIATVVVTV